jgi:hypothetical protein
VKTSRNQKIAGIVEIISSIIAGTGMEISIPYMQGIVFAKYQPESVMEREIQHQRKPVYAMKRKVKQKM